MGVNAQWVTQVHSNQGQIQEFQKGGGGGGGGGSGPPGHPPGSAPGPGNHENGKKRVLELIQVWVWLQRAPPSKIFMRNNSMRKKANLHHSCLCILDWHTGFFRSVVTKKRRESAHARILEGILNGELRACVDSRRFFVTTDLKNPVSPHGVARLYPFNAQHSEV